MFCIIAWNYVNGIRLCRKYKKWGKNLWQVSLVAQAVKNQIQFRYVLNDIWFASAENMNFIKQGQNKDFIMPLKENRKIALNQKDKAQ